MTRKDFLLSCLSCFVARLLPSPPKRPLLLFWVDEETEIFCAESIEDFNEFFGRGIPSFHDGWDDEKLTPENRGEIWDYAGEGEIIFEEVILSVPNGVRHRPTTARQLAEQMAQCDWFQKARVAQLSTQYN